MDKSLSLFVDHDDIPVSAFLGACVAVLGIRDSGKSNSAARLIEQQLAQRIPMTIVDVLGEYWGLKEKFNIFVVGRSAHTDIDIETATQAAAVAVWSIQERVSIILDVSDHDDETRLRLLKAYFEAVWKTAGTLRKPYHIVLEEAHNWIPQSGVTPVKPIFTRIAAEGRSRGLGIIMISQRSARLEKNVLTQANVLMLHQVRHGTDLDVYQQLIPSNNRKFVKDVVPKLQTGQAVFVSKEGFEVVRVLKRETYHAGFTPSLDDDEEAAPSLTDVSPDTLASLRLTLKDAQVQDAPETDDPTIALNETIEELRQQNADQALRIKDLEGEVERLSKLEVNMPSDLHINAVMPYGDQSPYGVVATPVKKPSNRAAKQQQNRFDALLNDVSGVWPMHRAMLAYLLRRDDLVLPLPELAKNIDYQARTVIKNPPTTLVKLGLLQRTKLGGRSWEYMARETRKNLAKAYPDLDTDDLVQQLLTVCRAA